MSGTRKLAAVLCPDVVGYSQQATRIIFAINLAAAQALGLEMPPPLLAAADGGIE